MCVGCDLHWPERYFEIRSIIGRLIHDRTTLYRTFLSGGRTHRWIPLWAGILTTKGLESGFLFETDRTAAGASRRPTVGRQRISSHDECAGNEPRRISLLGLVRT